MKIHWHLICRQISILLFFLLTMVLIFPVTHALLLLLTLHRLLVQGYVRCFRKDLHHSVSGLSALFAQENLTGKNSKLNMMASIILEGPFTLQDCAQEFHRRFDNLLDSSGNLLFPELRMYWTNVGGYLFWKWEDHFEIYEHFRNYQEDSIREGTPLFEKDLAQIMGAEMPRKWAEGRSPWEILRVSHYYPQKSATPHVVLIFRCHHALGDAYSGMQFMEIFGNSSLKLPQPNFRRHRRWEKVVGVGISGLRLFYDFAQLVVDSVDGRNSWHRFDQKLSRDYRVCIVEERYSCERIKSIKSAYGVCYAAVLLAAMCGGIRGIMEDAGQKVPKRMSIAFPLPLAKHPKGLANHMWIFTLKLPIGTECPEKRLKIIFRQMNRSQFYGGWLVNWLSFKYFSVIPSPILRLFMNKLLLFSMIVSIFPFAQEPIDNYFDKGVRVKEALFLLGLPAGKIGVTATSMSSFGRQVFSFCLDKTLCPSDRSLANLGGYILQDLNSLYDSRPNQTEKAALLV